MAAERGCTDKGSTGRPGSIVLARRDKGSSAYNIVQASIEHKQGTSLNIICIIQRLNETFAVANSCRGAAPQPACKCLQLLFGNDCHGQGDKLINSITIAHLSIADTSTGRRKETGVAAPCPQRWPAGAEMHLAPHL